MKAIVLFLHSVRKNPSLAAVAAEGFLARLGFGVITFALPFYALSMGMSFAEIGLLAALRLVAANLFKPLMAPVIARFGSKQLYAVGVAGRLLVGILFAFATQPWMLFVIRSFHGLTTAMRDPAATVLITEKGNAKRMASTFAWYATAREAGAALGYLVAGFMLTYTSDNYQAVFLFAAVTSVVSLGLVIRYVRVADKPRGASPDSPDAGEGASPPWVHYAVWAAMITASAAMVNSLFPVIATEYANLSKAEVSIIYTISTIAVVVGGPIFGWFSDNVSRRIVLAVRSLANAFSSLTYVLFPSFSGIAAARLSDDAGKAAFRPAWGSLMAEIGHTHQGRRRTHIITYLDTASSVGEAIGPVVAGFLWDSAGIYWMFGLRFGLAIVAESYGIWMHRRFAQATCYQREQS